MTLVWKMVLGIMATGAVMFAIACGNGDGDQRPSEGRSGSNASVSQQVQQEDLEECPPVVIDMRCVARDMSVRAGPGSYVEARGGSTVYAGTGSWVEAYSGSRVAAFAGSTVRYRFGASVQIEEDGADVARVTD